MRSSPLDLLGSPELPDHLELVGDRLAATCAVGAPDLTDPCLRVVAGGGKRLRPALTIAVADVGYVFDSRVVSAGAAVELVQIGSLVHDDIFDRAATRRGTPTINAVEGRDQALLAGTYLMARAASEATSAGQQVAADVARTVGLLCIGQATETQHLFDLTQTIDRYLFTIEAKTAALFACSCRVGALTAGLSEEHVAAFGKFGNDFGMAFQLIDDVLDLIGDPDRLGKPVGADLRGGVLTMPALLELADPTGGDLKALLTHRREVDLDQATRMIIRSGRIEEAVETARRYADEAADAIARIPGTDLLSTFPVSYLDWALEEFVAA
ncbi:MAG: polyprenyl synthetase family protein [Acidimicrobiales bacterium]